MSITILLVDDHPVLREGLRAILEAQSGLEIVGEADNGREAIRECQRLRPDVVVMDIAMPEINGIDAARAMRENGPLPRIVMLSMHAHTEYIFRALQAGADGYVVKESVTAEVADAIRSVHQGRRFLSESIADSVIDDYIRRRKLPADEDPLMRLSAREREVLQLIVEGRSTAEIADKAALSPKTVETYRSRLMRKLEITNLAELVKFAIKHGLTSVE
jgi:DNA-binding NarL/FixJ family response regulator